MLTIRPSRNRRIFIMAIPISGNDGLYIETGPWLHSATNLGKRGKYMALSSNISLQYSYMGAIAAVQLQWHWQSFYQICVLCYWKFQDKKEIDIAFYYDNSKKPVHAH